MKPILAHQSGEGGLWFVAHLLHSGEQWESRVLRVHETKLDAPRARNAVNGGIVAMNVRGVVTRVRQTGKQEGFGASLGDR